MSVRVRYAPSPTGSPHVGNIRTALFDHLFAQRHGGQFIVRIEDTDQARAVEGTEEEILESLRYVGAQWHEGPDIGGPHGLYRQSERKAAGIYQPIIDQLLESGAAYWAFDTPEELTEMREFQQINKQKIGYFGGVWRDATPAQVEAAREAGKPGVIRLRIPRGETIVIQDGIRGRVERHSDDVDDPVIIKGDGMPTYHFAAMVDDHLMDITHVFRGEEWISSAPKHMVLFKALSWTPPEFIHVPVIKGKDGAKLSKRHGDTACLDYRRAGYLGHALANFIALIGWAPGEDREVMSMQEMAEAFSIRGIQPSPGVFDPAKLDWLSGMHMRRLSADDLFRLVSDYSSSADNQEYWQEKDASVAHSLARLSAAAELSPALARRAVELEQERVTSLAAMGPATEFFFVEAPEFDEKAVKKWAGQEHVPAMFDAFCAALEGKQEADEAFMESMVKGWAEVNGFEKLGPVVHPTRVALTGKTVGPGLWELMAALGPAAVVRRLQRGREALA